MPGPAFIRGETVELRTIEEEDLSFIQEGRNHPAVHRYDYDTPTSGKQAQELYDNRFSDDDGLCFLIVPTDGEFEGEPVGYTHVYPFQWERSNGFLAGWVLPKAQRNGYALDAGAHLLEYTFEEIGLRRITAQTVAKNESAIAIRERLGFEREGVLREIEYVDGEWIDMIQYSLFAREWEGVRSVLEAADSEFTS